MKDRYSILINDPNKAFNSMYLNANGIPFFDLFANINIPESESVIGLNELNELRDNVSVSIILPYTKQNKCILAQYVDVYSIPKSTEIPVIVLKNDIETGYTKLKIVSYTEGGDEIGQLDCDIFKSDSFLRKLSELQFLDIFTDSGIFFNKSLILSDWDLNKHIWKRGEPIHYFPLVRYSNDMGAMTQDDLRPFINYLYLLETFACFIGYKLDAPLLNTDWFRKKWLYLLKPDFYNYPNRGQYFASRMERDTDTTISTSVPISFDNIIYDLGSHFAFLPIASRWELVSLVGSVKVDFEISLLVEPQSVGTLSKKWGLLVWEQGTPNTLVNSYESVMFDDINFGSPVIPPTQYLVKLSYKSVEVKTNQFVEFGINLGTGTNWSIKFKGTGDTHFMTVPNGKIFYTNDDVYFEHILRNDVTPLSLYKAAMHLINGKLQIDENLKIVRLLHAESNNDNALTTGVESYFKNLGQTIDLTEMTGAKSYEVNYENTDIDRYINFSFQNSNNPIIEQLNTSLSPNTVHGKRVDLGAGYRDTTYNYENPVFAPIINVTKLIEMGIVSPNAFDMPIMWDNEGGAEISYDLPPTIIHIENGRYGQYVPPPTNNISFNYKLLNFDGVAVAYLPFSYQYTTGSYNTQFLINQALDENTFLTYEKLADIFYKKSIVEKTNTALAKITLFGRGVYERLNFRNIILIFTKTGRKAYKVLSKNRINKHNTEVDIISIDFKNNCK